MHNNKLFYQDVDKVKKIEKSIISALRQRDDFIKQGKSKIRVGPSPLLNSPGKRLSPRSETP